MSRVSEAAAPWLGHSSQVRARDPVALARARVARLAARSRYPGLKYVVVEKQ